MYMIVDKCDTVQTYLGCRALSSSKLTVTITALFAWLVYIKHQGKSSEEFLEFQSYAPCYYNICSLNFLELYLARIDGSTC